MGWDTLLNGDLLRVAEEAGFDVLVTADKNLCLPAKLERSKNSDRGSGQKPVEHPTTRNNRSRLP
jgi:hypothetical protein